MTNPGPMMPPPPGQVPQASDRTVLFGVLGIVLGICFWPAGLLFSILSMNAAKRAANSRALGIAGLVISIVVGIFSITYYATK